MVKNKSNKKLNVRTLSYDFAIDVRDLDSMVIKLSVFYLLLKLNVDGRSR